MQHILVYSDSLSWGIIPKTRKRLLVEQRWPGVINGSRFTHRLNWLFLCWEQTTSSPCPSTTHSVRPRAFLPLYPPSALHTLSLVCPYRRYL